MSYTATELTYFGIFIKIKDEELLQLHCFSLYYLFQRDIIFGPAYKCESVSKFTGKHLT